MLWGLNYHPSEGVLSEIHMIINTIISKSYYEYFDQKWEGSGRARDDYASP